jgi:hypothetical protein
MDLASSTNRSGLSSEESPDPDGNSAEDEADSCVVASTEFLAAAISSSSFILKNQILS